MRRNERVHIWVTGRVQGVGFRSFVQDCGMRLGLTGWVRNVGYDEVEALAEGPRPQLELFYETVITGPRAARVDQVRMEWESATGEYSDFNYKYIPR